MAARAMGLGKPEGQGKDSLYLKKNAKKFPNSLVDGEKGWHNMVHLWQVGCQLKVS